MHVLTGFAAERFVDDGTVFSEFDLICSDLHCLLFPVEHEIELRNRADLEILSRFSILLDVYCAEYNIFVWISSACRLKLWLEGHAGRTGWRPEIYDNTLVVLYDLLKLHQTRNLEDLAMDWFARGSSLHLATHPRHSASASHLLHHLLHHLGIVCHLLQHLRIDATLLHHLLDLWIVHHLLHHLWVVGQLLEHGWVHAPGHTSTTWHASSHAATGHPTHAWHSTAASHAHTSHSWLLLTNLSGLQLCLGAILVEEIIRIQLQRVLHLHHHGSN